MKYKEEIERKVKIIRGNKPAPGSTPLKRFFKTEGLSINEIHPKREKHEKISVTKIYSNFSLNFISIQISWDRVFSLSQFLNYFFL